jgi:beta-N-acetylhexosaminidase
MLNNLGNSIVCVVFITRLIKAYLSMCETRQGVDAILVDLQDVGVRLYTFIWTMFTTMQAASILGARFVVADRPNPLGGLKVDGPILNMTCCASGYGRAPITHIHGLTIGELALFFNHYLEDTVPDLVIVKAVGWQRSMTWDETGLEWILPSPNLPTFQSSLAYGATVFIEATTVAEGRGTTTPFTLFGAPFFNATSLALALNKEVDSPTFASRPSFRAAYFDPSFSKFNGTDCAGVQWVRKVAPSFETALSILVTLRKMAVPLSSFSWDGSWFGHPGNELIDDYMGTPRVRELINGGFSARAISIAFSKDASDFSTARKPFLLYSDEVPPVSAVTQRAGL